MSDTPCTPDQPDTRKALETALAEAERRAWDNLARYKFSNFGYWSSLWVNLNRIGGFGRPNPFRSAVHLARTVITDSPAERQAVVRDADDEPRQRRRDWV